MASASNQTTFTINVKGDQTGDDYKGAFTIKVRLTHREQLLRDQYHRELAGPGAIWDSAMKRWANVTDRAQNQSDVFSEIWVHLIDAPMWWKSAGNGLDLIDDSVVAEVYQGIAKAKAEYLENLKKAAEAAQDELKKTEVK